MSDYQASVRYERAAAAVYDAGTSRSSGSNSSTGRARCWDFFLRRSLRQLIETGAGLPVCQQTRGSE